MYATKQQLLDLIGILENSCTTDDDGNTSDHHHDLFDNIDRGLMFELQTELENEIAEQPTNLETK
jgi:hypothetical protein